MNRKERVFVAETLREDEGLEIIQKLMPFRFPFLLVLDSEGFCLHPLGPGDRVYIRNVKEEDLLIVHLLDDEEALLRMMAQGCGGDDKT